MVRRFDRGADGQRIHVEDFAQVLGVQPSRKYEGAAFHIAALLNETASPEAALEFVRRLAFAALTGNGDMHLKNWSLMYPGDGDRPALAPIYDVLSTVPYIPTDAMALSLGRERSFEALTASRWKASQTAPGCPSKLCEKRYRDSRARQPTLVAFAGARNSPRSRVGEN